MIEIWMPYKDKEQQRKFQREWRAKRRADWLREHGPCELCGSWENLEIDHKDREQKISHKVWSWQLTRREAELAKCRVLCHRCHKERTREQLTKPLVHGTHTAYWKGCRCNVCKSFAVTYAVQRRRERMQAQVT